MGKGSTRRPTDEKKYQDNWDKIFGKKKGKKDEEPSTTDKLQPVLPSR